MHHFSILISFLVSVLTAIERLSVILILHACMEYLYWCAPMTLPDHEYICEHSGPQAFTRQAHAIVMC